MVGVPVFNQVYEWDMQLKFVALVNGPYVWNGSTQKELST